MKPQVQYCTTGDGVTIAFSVIGEGQPLLYLPPIWQHSQLDWDFPQMSSFYNWLASRFRFIRVDPRNYGLSQRGVEDVSLEAIECDVSGVADKLGLEKHSLFGHGLGGNAAIAYAAHHPGRVHRLIVCNATLLLRGIPPTPGQRALNMLVDQDWETFTEVAAGMVWGWESGEGTRRFAELLRASATHEDVKRWSRGRYDVTDLLPKVSAPTLIIHQRDAVLTTIETGRHLAAGIGDARLVPLEGRSLIASYTDPSFRSGIDEFFDEDGHRTSRSMAPTARGFRTVLFTDLIGHTEMMQRLGDAKGRAVLREHERITRETLKQHGGAEVKTMGDGFMASFGSVTSAVDCAIALQRAFAAHTESMPEPLNLRVGLNAGEPIEEEGDLFGSTVILASRIAAKAGAGEILIPEPLRHLLSGKTYVYADRGETLLKGFEDAVRLYEVRWRD